jgi:hypothetical protein
MALKAILSWLMSAVALVIGLVTLYQLFAASIPNEGWTTDNLVSLGFASFMLAVGGTEIFKRTIAMLPKGEDSKRCGSCGAMMPLIAKFCRECGTHFSQGKT